MYSWECMLACRVHTCVCIKSVVYYGSDWDSKHSTKHSVNIITYIKSELLLGSNRVVVIKWAVCDWLGLGLNEWKTWSTQILCFSWRVEVQQKYRKQYSRLSAMLLRLTSPGQPLLIPINIKLPQMLKSLPLQIK